MRNHIFYVDNPEKTAGACEKYFDEAGLENLTHILEDVSLLGIDALDQLDEEEEKEDKIEFTFNE